MTSRISRAILILILAGSFALKLVHLNHAAVKPLDEVFHAIVARNFLAHPFTPTLVDRPWLPYDEDNWLSNHIWLHKPPMAMWQIAIFYAILGVNTFALRLPSAILSTLAAWLTYLIGVRLLDRTAALIATFLQAFNPVIVMLVQGYVFSDHVDISLLFWTELSIYFLVRAAQSRSRTDIILCGIAQGLAFLSKTYPALIVTLLALAIIRTLGVRGVVTLLLATILTAAPWLTWTAIRFPHEFVHENVGILHHLSENVESWAGPWDQLVFYYWISIFYVFYPAIIAAAALFFYRAIRRPTLAATLISVWAIGVMVPNLLATSKPMTATLIGWPAAWLIFGDIISRAIRGDRAALGVWFGSMLLAVLLMNQKSIPTGGEYWNQTSLPFATIMRHHQWVLWQSLAAVIAGIFFARVRLSSFVQDTSLAISAAAMAFLTFAFHFSTRPAGYLTIAIRVTATNVTTPNFTRIGKFAAKLPANAAFLVDEREVLENKLLEFAANRTCYPARREDWYDLSQALDRSGALPYLLTSVPLDLPAVFVDPDQHRTVYACTPAAQAAATSH